MNLWEYLDRESRRYVRRRYRAIRTTAGSYYRETAAQETRRRVETITIPIALGHQLDRDGYRPGGA